MSPPPPPSPVSLYCLLHMIYGYPPIITLVSVWNHQITVLLAQVRASMHQVTESIGQGSVVHAYHGIRAHIHKQTYIYMYISMFL
jgi:hypothetical protein